MAPRLRRGVGIHHHRYSSRRFAAAAILGPSWFWWPGEWLGEWYPYPEPYPGPYVSLYSPPGYPPGYWYWCDTYQAHYPYVAYCPFGWQAVVPY